MEGTNDLIPDGALSYIAPIGEFVPDTCPPPTPNHLGPCRICTISLVPPPIHAAFHPALPFHAPCSLGPILAHHMQPFPFRLLTHDCDALPAHARLLSSPHCIVVGALLLTVDPFAQGTATLRTVDTVAKVAVVSQANVNISSTSCPPQLRNQTLGPWLFLSCIPRLERW